MTELTVRCREIGAGAGPFPDSWHPVLGRVLAARGVFTKSELGGDLGQVHPPDTMSGAHRAAKILAEAIRADSKILIVGDYDADGATATVLMIRGLRMLGAQHVTYLVPNRFAFGYGLSPELVATLESPLPDLIVTVDNGIASLSGVEAARSLGIKVIITDHHLQGEQLPEGDAIVNPNQTGCAFPSKHLAGVGVAFYLLIALRRLRREDGESRQPALAGLLDLVALGTVADLVHLDRNNRILVEQGLRRIRAGRGSAGIMALIAASGRDYRRITSSDLGYAVAPRLNAAGRMDDMCHGIECLLATESESARLHAEVLERLNSERRTVQAEMQVQADELIKAINVPDADARPLSVVLHDSGWHEGIVGLLASRVKDRVHRPVVAFATSQMDGSLLRGSARSIRGFHIRDALAQVDVRAPGLIKRFGGHAMAAGLTILRQDLPRFESLLCDVVTAGMPSDLLQRVILTDGDLTPADYCMELAEQLRSAAPWGQAFPAPLFEGWFDVREHRVVGGAHLKLVVCPRDGGGELDAIAFYTPPEALPEGVSPIRMLYQLDVNQFRGRRTLQLLVEEILK